MPRYGNGSQILFVKELRVRGQVANLQFGYIAIPKPGVEFNQIPTVSQNSIIRQMAFAFQVGKKTFRPRKLIIHVIYYSADKFFWKNQLQSIEKFL